MSRGTLVAKITINVLLVAILYRYWLVAPVLHYLSVGRWRLVAIMVAFAIGFAMAVFRLSTIELVGAGAAGLLLGGTWAAWLAPSDIHVPISWAFVSHVEVFWRQLILLSISITVGGFCYRFSRRLGRRRGRG